MDALTHLRRRAPFLILGVVSLLAGLWAGLLRLGFEIPELRPELATQHGPLMALGFLGTLISLERAVALDRRWAYAAPLCFGLGMLATLIGWQVVGGWLLVAGAVLFVAIFIAVLRIQLAFHGVVMAFGAVAAVIAAACWLDGRPFLLVAAWLTGFLVFTIAGERLELARFVQLTSRARWLFVVASAIFGAGLIITTANAPVGTRILGAGLIVLAAWLARFDIARRTIRRGGLTRFMAACLLAGYAWLAVGGVIWIVSADAYGWSYDAKLHAVFLGFVMSMIFGHAAVIFPSVFRIAVPYRRIYWVHLALLHVGVAIRLSGDATESLFLWRTGGVLNETAILLFLAVTVVAAVTATRARAETAQARAIQREAAG